MVWSRAQSGFVPSAQGRGPCGSPRPSPTSARSMMRTAMVIRVQHLEQISAELGAERGGSGCRPVAPHPLPALYSGSCRELPREPAARPDVVVVRHVNVEDQLLLLRLEGPQVHRVVLVGLWDRTGSALTGDPATWGLRLPWGRPAPVLPVGVPGWEQDSPGGSRRPRCRSCRGWSSAAPAPAPGGCRRTGTARRCRPAA